MTGSNLSGLTGFHALPRHIKHNVTQTEFLKQHGYFTKIPGKEFHSMMDFQPR